MPTGSGQLDLGGTMIRETRKLMGTPITVAIVDRAPAHLVDDVFEYFLTVDKRFSLDKPNSEMTAFNDGLLAYTGLSPELQDVLALAARTRRETRGYFEIRRPDGTFDPSGLVKGWAVRNAAHIIYCAGVRNYMIDAGGDVQTGGRNVDGEDWTIDIRSPFDAAEIVTAIAPRGHGVASRDAISGCIYNPHRPGTLIENIASLTVIGRDLLDAERFATAAFAMGEAGIAFIDAQPGIEGLAIDAQGVAVETRGFRDYVRPLPMLVEL
jgi:FAD:protein FMN transferase